MPGRHATKGIRSAKARANIAAAWTPERRAAMSRIQRALAADPEQRAKKVAAGLALHIPDCFKQKRRRGFVEEIPVLNWATVARFAL